MYKRQTLASLRADLPYNLRLGQIQAHIERALTLINETRETLAVQDLPVEIQRGPAPLSRNAAEEWLDEFSQALISADTYVSSLIASYAQIMEQAEMFVNEMDFRFLYHSRRRVFHIGFNLNTGNLDQNYYDLLASEARIASIIAIAKGDVPHSHWLHLGRPVTRVDGNYVLLSWSGTMFEYLMPALFLRSYPGTMLADSAQGAVRHQIAYGEAKEVPWGISESGFYRFDADQNYQYRAFGIPGLGYKRGLGDDLVVSPYACLLYTSPSPRD